MPGPVEIPASLPPPELQLGPTGLLQPPPAPPAAGPTFADRYVAPYQLPTPDQFAQAQGQVGRPDLTPFAPGGVQAAGTPAVLPPTGDTQPPPFAPPGMGGAPPSAALPASAPAPPPPPRHAGGPAGAPSLEQQGQAATAAEMKAQGAAGDANAQASTDQATANADAAKAHADQAIEYQRQRDVNAKAFSDAQAQQQQALEKARDQVIPDFYDSKHGSRVRSAIGMFLMGAGGGVEGVQAGHNIVQSQVDSYYKEKREKIDNMFKFAEAKGKMTDDLRLQQASDLATLQLQHGATNLSIADHIQEVIAQSQGRVDKTKAGVLMAATQRQGVKDMGEAREQLQKIALMKAQANEASAKASHERAAGAGLKAAASDEKFITSELDKDEARLRGSARSPGILARAESANAAAADLKNAMASGDPEAIKVAVMHVKEQSTRFLTGAAPSVQTMKMNEDLKGTPAEVESRLSRILGNPTEGAQFTGAMLKNIEGIQAQNQAVIGNERNAFVQKYHGPGGLASTPTRKAAALGRGAALFDDDPTGQTRATVPAAAGPPPGAITGSMNGKRGYVLNGQFVAL